ncbi:amidohydrolase family protein [Chloroflexota bacterium]
MIIDCHTHVLSPRIKDNRSRYADRDAAFALIYANEKAKIATAEELIESMDRDGVDISVIASYGWSTPELCLETNDYIMESVARYPERLIGFGAVPPSAGEAAAAEIGRCARGGMRGIGELRPDLLAYCRGANLPFADGKHGGNSYHALFKYH